jgi:hypothetical protein
MPSQADATTHRDARAIEATMCNRSNRHWSWRAVLWGSIVLTTCACAAPVDPPSNLPAGSVNACHTRVVITFAQGQGERPTDDFVMEISRAANVVLVFVRAAGPGLYVFQLDADDTDESCSLALARLRQDERVRSVDLDQRRHVLE